MRCILVLLSALLAAPAAPADSAPDLEAVMAALAGAGGVRARYEERKHLSLLTRPLEEEGRLYFAPPDRLARHAERPVPGRVMVRGDEVVIADATGEERVSIADSEIARAFVEGLAVVLRGDLEALRARYEVAFSSTQENGWKLRLVPRSRLLRRFVEAIAVSGRGARVQRMERFEAGGDRTVSEFHDVEVGVRFAPEEERALFGAPAPAP